MSMPVNKRVLKTKDKLLIINCIDSGVFKRFPLVLLNKHIGKLNDGEMCGEKTE